MRINLFFDISSSGVGYMIYFFLPLEYVDILPFDSTACLVIKRFE